ncbi:rho GTPase-activating protein 29 [Ditylenchus destructor]|nr:rho GTPase-activating protein 29 [Ditylenchus destructor]
MDPSTSDIKSSNVPNIDSADNYTEVEAGAAQPEEHPLHMRRKSKPKVHIGKHLCVDTSKQSLTRFDLILLETFQDESLNESDGKPCSSCCQSFDTGDSQIENEDLCDDYSVSSSSLSSTSTFVDQFRAIRDLANLAEEEEEEQENDEREQNCRMEFTDRLFRMSTDGEKSGEDLCAEEKDSGSESLPPNAAQFEEDLHPCEDKNGCTLNGRSLVQEQSPRDGQAQHCAARFNSNWSDKIPSYRKKSNPSSIPPRLESTTASSGFSSGSYSSSNGPGISTTGGGIANAAVHLLNGVLSLPPNSELSSNSNGTMEQAHQKIGSYRPPLAAGQATQPVPTKMPHHARLVRRHSTCQPDRINSAQSLSTLRLNNAQHHSTGGEFPGIELDSTAYQSPGRANGTCDSASACLMKELLCDYDNGLEMAFDRCKAWSKYAGHLLSFMRSRLSLEHDHVRNMQKLADQTKSLLVADSNNNYLPLVNIFDELMDNSLHFSNRAEKTINTLQHRFICTLENRQKEHDLKRRKLKSDWAKQKKQLDTCADELRRARQNLNAKEGGYMKARDSALRHEQSVPPMGLPSNVDPQKKRKELEKKRKTEEDAFIRKTDAENEVTRLERELEARKIGLSELRERKSDEALLLRCQRRLCVMAPYFLQREQQIWHSALAQQMSRTPAAAAPLSLIPLFTRQQFSILISYFMSLQLQTKAHSLDEEDGDSLKLHVSDLRIIGELCDLIRHCDLTTTACASHFFKAFADLFAPVPEDYEKLAHLTIHESPGSEYMAFLQSQNFPARSVSTSSLPRADKCGDSDKNSFAQCRSPYTERERIYMRDRHHSSANMASAPSACSSSMTSANDASSPSMPNRRRNALNADEHEHIIAETTQRRQKKSMSEVCKVFKGRKNQTSNFINFKINHDCLNNRRPRQLNHRMQPNLISFNGLGKLQNALNANIMWSSTLSNA